MKKHDLGATMDIVIELRFIDDLIKEGWEVERISRFIDRRVKHLKEDVKNERN